MFKLLQKNFRTILSFSALLFIFAACNSSGENNDLGSLEIRLHDAPLDSVEEVNVFIERIEINLENDDEGWSTINSPNRSFNLLELTNGAFEVIGDTLLEPGTYSQIRLILGQDNNLVISDSTYSLFVPSGSQSGIKLNINAEIEAERNYVLLLDFDVAKSIVQTGNQQSGVNYILNPVIRANFQAETGKIAGVIEPAEARPIIFAIQDSDTLASTFADTLNGEFQLMSLPEGVYRVAVEPRNDKYVNADINEVEVVNSETTDLGTIEINQNSPL